MTVDFVIEIAVGEEKSLVVVEEVGYSAVVAVAAVGQEKIFVVEVEKSFAAAEEKKTAAVVDVEQSFAVVEREVVVVLKGQTVEGFATGEKIVGFVAVLAAPEISVGYSHLNQD